MYRASGNISHRSATAATGTPCHVAIALHPSTQWCLTVYVVRGIARRSSSDSDCGLRTSPSTRSCHFAGSFSSRSEEHTSELQSHVNLVCRLLLEKKKKKNHTIIQSYQYTPK